MTNNEYLKKVLTSQKFGAASPELERLDTRRAEVEKVLRECFGDSPAIEYGGSRAKGTMIRASYDLDIICYFPHADDVAGDTLKEIYGNVRDSLSKHYLVEQKPSAVRIKDASQATYGTDFHIDVVPGRYTDDAESDVFLYQASGDKERLKTNLGIHIKHVKESGVVDAICLLKLWKILNGMRTKTFILELLTVNLLKGNRSSDLATQLQYIWEQFRDKIDDISIEDPANPEGNDLSDLFNAGTRSELSERARHTLAMIESSGWEAVFGPVEEENKEVKVERLRRATENVAVRTKPWAENR